MQNSCFVIMPIGTQKIGDVEISESELKKRYDFIIKEAILKADPTIEVIRADEELNPSSISNDIFTKLMYSKYVIADITYPNPNVFYELGIRHAISSRTILIRENVAVPIPFDVSHLRYINYTHSVEGMHTLSEQLKKRFDFYSKHPQKLDNQFLELCSFTNFVPKVYKQNGIDPHQVFIEMLTIFMSNPTLMNSLSDNSLSPDEQQNFLLTELSKNPEELKKILSCAIKLSELN